MVNAFGQRVVCCQRGYRSFEAFAHILHPLVDGTGGFRFGLSFRLWFGFNLSLFFGFFLCLGFLFTFI